ncbi:MAG: hypothetical protein AABX94_04730 [Nanoarchaeota archaeon]
MRLLAGHGDCYKSREEIVKELETSRVNGNSFLLVFSFTEVDLDYCPSEEIPGKRLDETPLDSPIGERRHEIFRYVKPGETLAEAIKREEDPRIDFVLNRVYRIPTEGERVTTNSLERYLVPKPRESTK